MMIQLLLTLKLLKMKLIESKAELLPWEPGIEGVYKAIERAGRVCYKSESKSDGTAEGAKAFVDRMIASKHTAMLEHGTVYLTFNDNAEEEVSFYYEQYSDNKYSIYDCDKYGYVYVTTNLRVLAENRCIDDLKYLSDSTEFHEMRYSFKFTCSRGIMAELTRHRAFSFAVESTRYCGYDKDKFNKELTFVMPQWYLTNKYDSFKMNEFDKYLENVEDLYMFYRDCAMQPQEARDILPLTTKTEVVMTGFASDWRYLFDLRLFGKTGAPHPDMVDLMEKAKAEAEKNGIWEDIMSYPSRFE